MYFHEYFNVFHNWTEIIFLAPELKAEPQGKATIAITTQYEVQRITTSKNKLQLIVTNPNRLTVYVRRSLWFTVAPREFWTFQSIRCAPMNSLRWATIPFAKVQWTATNNNILGDFCHESGFLAVRQKVVTVWPRLYKPGLIWAMTMAQNSLIQQWSNLLTGGELASDQLICYIRDFSWRGLCKWEKALHNNSEWSLYSHLLYGQPPSGWLYWIIGMLKAFTTTH